MGRLRTKDHWLPLRCYVHRQQIIYRPLKGKPITLGPKSDPGACLRKYGEIAGPGPRPRTMGDVIDKYLSEIVPTKAARTQEDYREYCANLKKAFGHMLPDEITINDLYDYHEARRAPVRANREITILGSVYRQAIRWRASGRNPVRDFLFAPERGRERIVTPSERRTFARRYAPAWLRGYLCLKLLTGRRQGELLKLTRFSEKQSGISFRILKKRKERELIVQWTPRLRKVWKWLLALPRPKDTAAIFIGERGKPVNARSLKSVWYRSMGRWEADGNVRFWEHDLRAFTAGAAESDERARELLDHGSLATTRKSYRRTTAKVRPLR
jgi:integrase